MALTKACGKTITVLAPFSGVVRALDAVPDPAFAQGMLGEGVAIDPLDDVVLAPFDGTVAAIARTGHSITLRCANGLEVLVHVGLDTLALQHDGFTLCVEEGQRIKAGERLLQFDLDRIAGATRDCISPVIVVSSGAKVANRRDHGPVAAGEAVFTVTLEEANPAHSPTPSPVSAPTLTSRTQCAELARSIALPHGIHARPAGQIARFARGLAATTSLNFAGRSARCTSITQLMALGVRCGDQVVIRAEGANSASSAQDLADLLADMAVSEGSAPPAAMIAAPYDQRIERRSATNPSQWLGVIAARGLGIGPVAVLTQRDPDVPDTAASLGWESASLRRGLAALCEEVRQSAPALPPVARQIAEAHLAILEDDALIAVAEAHLAAGANAAAAWRKASREQEAALTGTGNARLQERAMDLRDVERRLIRHITRASAPQPAALVPPGSVLICEDVAPSLLIDGPALSLAAICCAKGGATSHAAILAAAAGIPMLVSLGTDLLDLEVGSMVIVDGDAGVLESAPSAPDLKAARDRAASLQAAHHTALAAAIAQCRLTDGHRVEVFANLAGTQDAALAVEHGAEGCGLLRTEFVFAERSDPPGEDEQIAAYRAIAEALEGRPCLFRVLDVGGDKPLSFFPFPPEDNPALGMRGVRCLLQEKTFLRTQLSAMLRAVPPDQLRIVLPMLVEVDEFREIRALTIRIAREQGIVGDVALGVMIETPAAAMLSDQLAAEADFLSIGSNDLSQYVLAMDRGNAALASRIDGCHPAVLRMIAETAKGARRHGRWLGICGGMASDPDLAPVLVGLGCDELSAVPRAVPAIKQTLRRWSLAECQSLAARAMTQVSAQDVRRLVAGERK